METMLKDGTEGGQDCNQIMNHNYILRRLTANDDFVQEGISETRLMR
jgi:hypothetical protein